MAFKSPFKLFSQLPPEKKQQLLTIILIIVVLATVSLLYFGFRRSPSGSLESVDSLPMAPPAVSPAAAPAAAPAVVSAVPSQEYSLEQIIEAIDFDLDFLKEDNFRALKAYGQWPFEIEKDRRSNPFLPY